LLEARSSRQPNKVDSGDSTPQTWKAIKGETRRSPRVFVGEKCLIAYIQKMTSETSLKNLKRWRMIQFASILPLVLCMAWMFYFREASEFGIVGFFLVLIIGVMFPEVKADLAATNFLFRQELAMHREDIQKLLTEQLQSFLKDPAMKQKLNDPE
jgi:hypothetical protein